MSRRLRTIAIVGGAASGVLAAIGLLRHPSVEARRMVIVEPARLLGAGVAYGTGSPVHLLNVRTLGMSALADDPTDFLGWARRQGMDVTGTEFLPRARYADYLRDTLARAAADAPSGVVVEHRRGRVAEVVPDPVGPASVRLDDGSSLVADDVLLATGHRPTTPAWLPHHPRVVLDPWRPDALDAIDGAPRVLVLGSGLTAVDVVLSLQERGFTGTATLVSRHVQLPAAHRPSVLAPRAPAVRPGSAPARTARALVRALREDAWSADDWRQTVDGIRGETVALWRGLPIQEQRRALRHAHRFWETRRHRMAPEVAQALDALMVAGRVAREQGRVVSVTADSPTSGPLLVTIARGGTTRSHEVDAVISCIGPSADPADDPLLCRMLSHGSAARHPLHLGLDVEPDGRLRAAGGTPWHNLWAVGPLRKGAEWESTAVPEIRLHARDLAVSLLGPV